MPHTIAGPDHNPARLVLHMRRREKRGKEGRSEGKIFPPRCPLLSLSSPLPIHPAFSLLKIYSFFYNHSHPSLHSPFSTGPCPLLNSGCGTSTCTLAHVHEGEKQISEKHTRKKKREKKGGRGGEKSRSAAREKDKVNCQHNTGLGFEEKKKKPGWRARSPL